MEKLLLHSCCAPCSSGVLDDLRQKYDITVFFFNPNIYPVEEYDKRAKEQEKYQRQQLDNELKTLSNSLDECNNQIKKLIFNYNEYKKQVPEQFVANKDKSIILGFARFREESLAKCSLKTFNELLELIESAIDNNQDLTLTYDEWRVQISSGGRFAKGSHEVRLNILSELEKAIINRYETICFTSRAEAELISYKVILGSEEDLPLVGRGGIREITYRYTAAEWASVKKSLNYEI